MTSDTSAMTADVLNRKRKRSPAMNGDDLSNNSDEADNNTTTGTTTSVDSNENDYQEQDREPILRLPRLNDAKLLEEVVDDVDYEDQPERYDFDFKKLWLQERGLMERIDGLLKDIARLTDFKGHYRDMVIPSDDEDDLDDEDSKAQYDAPEWCVPIKANVMTFDWESLGKEVQFDVIMADPPWQLATHAPTRGVAISYQQLPDVCIEDLPLEKLQTNGFLFIWVINNKYAKAFEMMEKWGYKYVDDITWVKQTVNRRMAKGHGYYLQHAKETCLVGVKGTLPPYCRRSVGSDVIYSERRGQSQKPEQIYELIEEMMPGGKYLEIFGRKNNLRDYWITVGNEL
ncbi:MT-A70-domain-containing protein [Absidia repens]|uniref:mRNA m(6)A methyltransferase n=1 Tax=Absidia repens TaxID=90262 RepID=A0A1X2I006_9FUNG|nr:MT-A70-domain-containing protein [Absidia repens]